MVETCEPLVKLADIQGKGRALVASRPITSGQILLRDRPILVYPAPRGQREYLLNNTFTCSHCFRKLTSPSSPTILLCPWCSNASFCSTSCQSSALASSHSQWACKALSCLASASLSPDVESQANFLIAAYNLASVSPSDFNILLSLQGDGVENAESQHLHSFISAVMASHPLPNFAEVSPALTASLLSKDKQNAFGLMEPFRESDERLVRAYAIYPRASFFNHDCLPNACRFDYIDNTTSGNADIIIRALHDVSEGREICLSYFPVNWNYADRHRRLSEDYGFMCDCDRCKVEVNWKDEDNTDEDEDMDSVDEEATEDEQDFPHAYFFMKYLCDRENCGGTMAPLPPENAVTSNIMECNVCGQFKTEEDFSEDEDGENSMTDG